MIKVLIVDDSKEQLDIFKHYLKGKYDVYCCNSSIQAIHDFVDVKPDIVLLDIEMPLLDGFEVLQKIRMQEQGLNVPVVGVTGRHAKSVVLKFISLGATGYLVKPVTKELLIETIDKQVATSHNAQSKKRVLVVDDELDSLRIMQEFLKEDYAVTALNSGKLAIEYLYKHKPDLILLDYYMTPYKGDSLLEMIRKLELVHDVPVAFVTGTNDNDVILECSKLKPAGIILKPVKKDELLEKVHGMIQGGM